jgi:hypothetical protein
MLYKSLFEPLIDLWSIVCITIFINECKNECIKWWNGFQKKLQENYNSLYTTTCSLN